MERKIAALVTAIEDGRYSAALGERLAALEAEKAQLQAALASGARPGDPDPPRPCRALRGQGRKLEEALNDPAIREEANGLLRSLIERVELEPDGEGAMAATLYGDLAQIVAVCEGAAGNKKRPAAGAGGVLSVVAGAGFPLSHTSPIHVRISVRAE